MKKNFILDMLKAIALCAADLILVPFMIFMGNIHWVLGMIGTTFFILMIGLTVKTLNEIENEENYEDLED